MIKEYYFKEYISENICLEKSLTLSQGFQEHIIICDSSMKKNLKSFPSLHFFNIGYEYTFNMDYNDLFIEIENKIYFLIVGKDMKSNIWSLGKTFMKKYPLIFNEDKKTISFVYLNKFAQKDEQGQDKKKEDNNNHKKDDIEGKGSNNSSHKYYYLIIIIIICVTIGIVFGVIIGKKIWKKRRTRANELDDNVDYIEKDDKNNKMIN